MTIKQEPVQMRPHHSSPHSKEQLLSAESILLLKKRVSDSSPVEVNKLGVHDKRPNPVEKDSKKSDKEMTTPKPATKNIGFSKYAVGKKGSATPSNSKELSFLSISRAAKKNTRHRPVVSRDGRNEDATHSNVPIQRSESVSPENGLKRKVSQITTANDAHAVKKKRKEEGDKSLAVVQSKNKSKAGSENILNDILDPQLRRQLLQMYEGQKQPKRNSLQFANDFFQQCTLKGSRGPLQESQLDAESKALIECVPKSGTKIKDDGDFASKKDRDVQRVNRKMSLLAAASLLDPTNDLGLGGKVGNQRRASILAATNMFDSLPCRQVSMDGSSSRRSSILSTFTDVFNEDVRGTSRRNSLVTVGDINGNMPSRRSSLLSSVGGVFDEEVTRPNSLIAAVSSEGHNGRRNSIVFTTSQGSHEGGRRNSILAAATLFNALDENPVLRTFSRRHSMFTKFLHDDSIINAVNPAKESPNLAAATSVVNGTHHPNAMKHDRPFPYNNCSMIMHGQCKEFHEKRMAAFRSLYTAMEESKASQTRIHDWDKKMGLRRSHSQTMRNSSRSRKKLIYVMTNCRKK